MKKLVVSSLVVLLAFAAQAIAQSTSSSQTQSNQTSDQPGVGGVGSSASGDTATSPASEPSSPAYTQPGTPGSRTGQGAAASRRNSLGATAQTARQGMDQGIATCLALGNQEEIAVAQFAQQRAENAQVKQFAQKAIEDHQKLLAQLEQAVPQVANWKLEMTSAEGGARTTPGASRAASETAAAGGQAANPEQQFLEFGKEVKQECLALTQAELGKKQGAQFDKCYIGQQIAAHTGMLAELRVAEKHVSPQLRPTLQQATQVTEQHLNQARSIAEQLDAEGGGRTSAQARQPSTTAPARQ